MEIFTGATASSLSEIGKWVWNIAASKINYLLFYDRKVEELKHLVQELDIKKTNIQEEVDVAKRNGGNVREDVIQWFQNLDGVKEDARKLEDRVKEVRRFMGCCWDCFSSYKIGKEVAEKIATATELLNANFPRFTNEPSPPSIESLYPNRDFHESSSTKSSMDHIWEALNNEKNYIIGVYGMGGVGKTTIMKEVAKRAKNEWHYNEVIMVTVSQNQDVKRMQTEIAEKLGLKLTTEIENCRGGTILERIKRARKILIILDDLWDFLDTSEIGIPSADENKECKVVITTRSRDVCHNMECQKDIQVEPLTPEESWDLFKSKVGDVVEKTDNLKKVAMDVAKECGGLPLAIITLGRAMRYKYDIDTWNSVRTDLKNIKGMKDIVFKCIRKSFEYLSSEEAKLCFLFCSLFPEDWEIYIIEFYRYVVGEGILQHVYSMEEEWNRVWSLLGELKDGCLLLEGRDSEHFKMHDVVREVAIWISSDKTYGFYGFANKGFKRWPEIRQVDECQRISSMGNSFDSLPEQPIFPKLRTMILKETRISTIPDRFFQGMEALLVLDLSSEKVASLPSSFSRLVNLKALFLSRRGLRAYFLPGRLEENFDVTSLSLIGELKKLEILQLEGFEFGTVPKEFGNLTSLRCLDLLHCTGTIPRNLLSRLSRLEQLYLTEVFSNWQVEDEGSSSSGDGCAATFAELARLSCLTTLHVDIQNPQDLNFVPWPALTDFKIVVGTSILSGFGRPSSSRSKELTITKSTYKWVIDLVTKTERLCLCNWSGMECLIGGAAEEEGFTDVGHKLYEVEELALLSMPDMRSLCTGTLPNDILLRKLSRLVIKDCHKLIDVFPIPNKLVLQNYFPSLRELAIVGCHSLTYLLSWRQAKGLPHLQELTVVGCERMETVIKAAATDDDDDNDIRVLPCLKWFHLDYLPELRSVWGRDDDGVIMLPAGSLQNLQTLYVWDCKRLKDDHILPPILPIPNKLQNFPSLRELYIIGCHSLTYLLSWRQAKGLPHLETLYVGNCERMETVIKQEEEEEEEEEEESTVLPSLTKLKFDNLPMLRSFFLQGGEQCSKSLSFKSLKELIVVKCPKLKKLPLSTSSPALESLVGDSWEWFESLEWGEDQSSIKERLRPVFQCYQ